MEGVEVTTDVLVVGAWLAALVFVVRYLRTRWFRTPMGVHAMGFMAAVLVILSLASSYVIWPDWGGDGGRQIVRMISYGLINAILWWRVAILFRGQRGASAGRRLDERDRSPHRDDSGTEPTPDPAEQGAD